MRDAPEQLDIFGSAVPITELPALSPCTCDAGCRAQADEHLPECPVEHELRNVFGF